MTYYKIVVFFLFVVYVRNGFGAISSRMKLETLIEELYKHTQCDSFLVNFDWAAYAERNCGRRTCNYPKEICMQDVKSSFMSDNPIVECKRIPSSCYNAASSGGGGVDPFPTTWAPFTRFTTQGRTARPPRVTTESSRFETHDCSARRNMGKACGKRFVRRFYHTRGQCRSFLYRGCRGNTNNFEDEQACKSYCLSSISNKRTTTAAPSTGGDDVCNEKKLRGRVCGYKRRYYYDKRKKSCKSFWFGGCDGNGNNFRSSSECRDKCLTGRNVRKPKPKRPTSSGNKQTGRKPSHCYLAKNAGTYCSPGWKKRYYYDSGRNICKFFWYQSCGGNKNNFKNPTECRRACA